MRRQILLVLVLLWPAFFSFSALPTHVQFITGDLPAVQARAEREQKSYFIHFTANWCLPCQWMEENTFRDVTLADYIHRNYLPVKLNIDHPEGSYYQKQYGVVTLPTLLFFNSRGHLIDRRETSLDATELLAILRSHQQARSPEPSAVVPAPARPPAENNPGPATASPTPYEVPPARATFSIQAGAYGEYDNAIAHARRIEQRIRSSVSVVTTRHGGRAIYRVMIGSFATEAEAARYLAQIRQSGVEGFVKDTRQW